MVSRLALHEAAHAVIAAALGIKPSKHTIETHEQKIGFHVPSSPARRFAELLSRNEAIDTFKASRRRYWKQLIEKEAMITLAGGLAQNMFLGIPVEEQSEDDLRYVNNFLGWLESLGSKANLSSIEMKTKKMLKKYSSAIGNLAQLLDTRISLSVLPVESWELLTFYHDAGIVVL